MTDKTSLLLVPGLLCDAALWGPQMAALADVAEPIVADTVQDDSIAGMAERAIAAAPERFALAGLSMGGYVAQEIMRRAPERVIRLALLDSTARPDSPEQRKRRHDLIELAHSGTFHGVTPRLLPMLIHPQRLADKALTDIVMGMAERIGRDAFLRQQAAIMDRPDGRAALARIHVHTLVLCGAEDALTPVEAHREMAAGIADSRLVVVPNCGHLSTLEAPDRVNAEMRRWITEEL